MVILSTFFSMEVNNNTGYMWRPCNASVNSKQVYSPSDLGFCTSFRPGQPGFLPAKSPGARHLYQTILPKLNLNVNSPCKDNLKSFCLSTSAIQAKGQKSCKEKVKKFSQMKITKKKSFRTICRQLENIAIPGLAFLIRLVLVIAWFGGQLRINFLSKILKFFCNCPSL